MQECDTRTRLRSDIAHAVLLRAAQLDRPVIHRAHVDGANSHDNVDHIGGRRHCPPPSCRSKRMRFANCAAALGPSLTAARALFGGGGGLCHRWQRSAVVTIPCPSRCIHRPPHASCALCNDHRHQKLDKLPAWRLMASLYVDGGTTVRNRALERAVTLKHSPRCADMLFTPTSGGRP